MACIVLYIGHLKESTTTKIIRANKFSKVAGHKINIQNSVVFLYTSKNQPPKN